MCFCTGARCSSRRAAVDPRQPSFHVITSSSCKYIIFGTNSQYIRLAEHRQCREDKKPTAPSAVLAVPCSDRRWICGCNRFSIARRLLSFANPNRVPSADGMCRNAGSDPIGTLFLCAVRVHPIGTSIGVLVLRNAELEQCCQYNTAKLQCDFPVPLHKVSSVHRLSTPRFYFFFFTDGVYADRILICIAR